MLKYGGNGMRAQMTLLAALSLLLLAGLFACAQKPAGVVTKEPMAWTSEAGDQLEPGDEIEVQFLYWPELDDTQQIRRDGRISLQLVENIQAAGLTPEELSQKLEDLHKDKLKEPAIKVILRERAARQIMVGGEVEQPGAIELAGSMTPLEAIMAAGGFKRLSADISKVVVFRQMEGRRLATSVDLMNPDQAPFFLKPNDVIYVPPSY
ncbi:periplasmic protein involved in polysaccharide export [Desulfocurvibacter africanus PCS]|uniref:Periplasmic protein involved in polysaccharide export n=2 Tax=Desulfocurvibacter africanus TaxID=873 RepID=M5Q0Z3_DESAF|nr:periplasmic protein involved in polysaccharide export [Desulfocurvibacter africanus PCS]